MIAWKTYSVDKVSTATTWFPWLSLKSLGNLNFTKNSGKFIMVKAVIQLKMVSLIMHVFLLKCGLPLHVKFIVLVIISYNWKDDAERKLTNPRLLSLSFYTPVIRQDVLWFGNICGHICQSYVNTLFMEKLFIFLFSCNHAWVYVLLFVHLSIFLDVYM